MTTLIPREPYSQEELAKLYPKSLKLELVQVVSLVAVLKPIKADFRSSFAMVRHQLHGALNDNPIGC